MIFGGLVPTTHDASETTEAHVLDDNGTQVTLSAQSLILDVTVGSIKSGPELADPSYFISGGYKVLHSN